MQITFRTQLQDRRLVQSIPNILTLGAICAGLSSIRFSVQGDYSIAIQLIIAAAILDGLDGRVARLLGSNGAIGAELDTLADCLNFCIAPPILIYFWILEDLQSVAWMAVLIYAMCGVMRLARFNVSHKSDDAVAEYSYFSGVPTPAAAFLVMAPLYLYYVGPDIATISGTWICIYMIVIGILMISQLPTYSFKTHKPQPKQMKLIILGGTLLAAALITMPWATLIMLSFVYLGVVVWSAFHFKRHQES